MFGISWLYLWLGIFVISLIVELMTVGLTSIWMAGGALCAMIAAALNAPEWLQILLFFGVTFLLLIFTRPWAVRYLNSRRTVTNSNDEPVGKEVRVIETIDNRRETGKVMHHGIEWTARSADPNEVIAIDEIATVMYVEGVKLYVKRMLPVSENNREKPEEMTEMEGILSEAREKDSPC